MAQYLCCFFYTFVFGIEPSEAYAKEKFSTFHYPSLPIFFLSNCIQTFFYFKNDELGLFNYDEKINSDYDE